MKLSSVFFLFLLPTFIWSETVSYRADAYDQKSHKFLYSENHIEVWEKGKHLQTEVMYRDANDKPFARKLIVYKDSLTLPSFKLEDFRSGYLNGVEVESSIVKIFHRPSKTQSISEKSLPRKNLMISDGGFDYFIRSHFDELASGKTFEADFLAPTQLDYFNCRIVKTQEVMVNERKAVVFQLVPSSFLIKMLASPIFVTYDIQTKRLLVFEGTSNIESAPGKSNFNTRIVFNYPVQILETALK